MNNLTRFLRTLELSRPLKLGTRVFFTALAFGSISLSAISHAEEAEYYTWVDENGVTNYAERNPEGIRATFVGRDRAFGRPGQGFQNDTNTAQSNTPALPSAASPNSSADIDPDSLVEEDAAIMAAELAEQKRINCEAGKNNLAQLRAFARIRVSDEQGENRILTDEEKNAKAEEARRVIRDNCSG